MQAAARVMAWPCPHPAHRRHGDLPAHPVRHRARHVGVLRTEQPVRHLADPRCHHRAPHLGSALPSASCCRKSGSDIKTRDLHANDVTFDIGRNLTLPDSPRRPLAPHRRARRLAAPEKSALFESSPRTWSATSGRATLSRPPAAQTRPPSSTTRRSSSLAVPKCVDQARRDAHR